MKIGLLGRKLGMTRFFSEEGKAVPVTVLEVGPCWVTQLKTREGDGYTAVQLAFGERKLKRTPKAEMARFQKAGISAKRFSREIRTESVEGLAVGDELNVGLFSVGDIVDVEGISIGRGFQGVVKRHHFKGGGASHGSMFGRAPGSIGSSSWPSRVFKGLRAAGHMGNHRTTVQNLTVVDIDEPENLLVVRGQVPGFEGRFLTVRSAVKRPANSVWKAKRHQETGEKPKAAETETGPAGSAEKS